MDLRRLLYNGHLPDAPLQEPLPHYGLMTQTVAGSPVVKWILRAQLRREDINDIIIVRETSIELKQVVGRGLRTLAVKDDFDASIRAARILGKPKSPPSPRESERNFKERFADSGYTSDGSFMEIDDESTPNWTPQILVLSLRSQDASRLMFISARDEGDGEICFQSSIYALPSHKFDALRPDAHLTIDSEATALAAAAQSDTLILGSLRSRTGISNEMEANDRCQMDSFVPFKESLHLSLSAVILNIGFLQSPKDPAYENIVLLLLVLSAAGQTRIRVLEWDSSMSIRDIKDLWPCGSYPIPHYARTLGPSQVIPSANYCGFMLPFDKFILAYTDVNSGYNKPMKIDYPKESANSEKAQCLYEFGQPGQCRYWMAWARPYRHAGFSDRKQDALFLGREDGLVSFMMYSSVTGMAQRHEMGRVDISIDTGFESLDSGDNAEYNTSDLLLMAGNSSDGGLFQYYPRRMPGLRPSTLRNWTPLLDWTIAPAASTASSPSLFDPLSIDAGRIFACAGYGMRHSKLCEIRYGIEATCISQMPLQDFAVSRPTRLWLLPGDLNPKPKTPVNHDNQSAQQSNGALKVASPQFAILISSPGMGSQLVIVDEQGSLLGTHADSRLDMLIETNAETMASCITTDKLAVQVTEHEIRVMHLSDSPSDTDISQEKMESPISHGTIDGRTSTCLVALRTRSGYEVRCFRLAPGNGKAAIVSLGKIDGDNTTIGISTISLQNIRDQQVAIVGTAAGGLKIYKIDDHGFSLLAQYQFRGDSAVCESVCCLQRYDMDSSSYEAVLLCGLRNGCLITFRLSMAQITHLDLQYESTIGSSTVSVFNEFTSHLRSTTNPSSAIVVCHDMMFRFTLHNRESRRPSLHRVWICHPDMQCVPTNPIFAVGQFSSWINRRTRSRTMCYVDEKSLRIVNVESGRFGSLIPRPIRMEGTPRRVIYAQSIKKLVVACEELVVVTPRSASHERVKSGRQFVFSNLQLLETNVEQSKSTNGNAITVGLSGDRITQLLEWTPELNGSRWALLVVSVTRKLDNGGCIYIYRLGGQDGALKLAKEIPRMSPVHSIVAFGTTRLAYGCGNRLEVIELTCSDKGITWCQPSHLYVNLQSPARALSARENEIFISTAEHSHIVCALEEDRLVVRFTDYELRHALDHTYVDLEPALLIGTDSHGGIRGFWRPQDNASEHKLRPVFEARMTSPITRICRTDTGRSRTETPSSTENPTMLGVSLGGAFYIMDVIASNQCRLLRFLQNLLDRQPSICPTTYIDNEKRPLDPSTSPADKHVNGDVFRRLLDRFQDASGYLRSLMESPPREATTHEHPTDFPSAELRVQHFQNLVHQAFPAQSARDAYTLVVDYLEKVVRPVY